MKRKKIDKNILKNIYCTRNMSMSAVAKKFNCSSPCIRKNLIKYSIKIRNPKEAWQYNKKIINVSKEELYNLYCIKKLNILEISKTLKCGETTIFYKLRKFNIKTRKETIIISKDMLYTLYVSKKLSLVKVAKIFNCSSNTILYKLKKHKIKIRNRSEARLGYIMPLGDRKKVSKTRIEKGIAKGKNNPFYGIHRFGKTNPNYTNGKAYEPYTAEFNKPLKITIAKDWDCKCQFPKQGNYTENEKCRGLLSIHHKDYIKENCNKLNLIPLCRKHNSAVNANREYWQEYFTNLIKQKYVVEVI